MKIGSRVCAALAVVAALLSWTSVAADTPADAGPGAAATTWVDKLPDAKGKATGGTTDSTRGLQGNGHMYYLFDYKIHGVTLSGAVSIALSDQSSSYKGVANYELAVEQGKVRLYFADDKKGYRYIEATPGHPVQATGAMLRTDPYRVVIEAVDGEATGVTYRLWRK